MNLFRLSGAVILAGLLSVGCVHSPRTPSAIDISEAGPRLPEVEVIRLANQAAEERGVELNGFFEPDLHYSPNRKKWIVFFEGRNLVLSNYFFVWVDDRTGKTHFRGGR
jgi:hypothetical protein